MKSQKIANIFDVTQRTVFQWFKDYKELGIGSLTQQVGRGRKTKLSVEKDLKIVKKHIEAHPHQPKRAYALTLEEIDIKISYNTFKRFLYPKGRLRAKTLIFTYKRIRRDPAKKPEAEFYNEKKKELQSLEEFAKQEIVCL